MALQDLPDINFVDVDANKTTNDIITVYEGLADRNLYPGDPIRLFLTSLAQIIIQQRVLLNRTAKQTLLRYATDDHLDHRGALYHTDRLAATPAMVTVQYTLSTSLQSVTLIPVGSRVGLPGGNGIYFATTTPLEIPAGQTVGIVEALCTVVGTIGNGFIPGQITTAIDPIPFVQSVTNVTTSSGGADKEADDPYRERVHIAPESFSVAGPDGAYKYWAMSASQLIVDVSVTSPTPGVVQIIPLLVGGTLPTQEILDAVYDICSPSNVRPFTDHVTVIAPTVKAFDINMSYWIHISQAVSAASIQSAVNMAIQDYILWQKSKLGRDINPSELTRRVMQAGAHHVAITSPFYATTAYNQIAVVDQTTVTYGGLTDD